mgnify:CR=1 FL=1|jgi:hypothetical protein
MSRELRRYFLGKPTENNKILHKDGQEKTLPVARDPVDNCFHHYSDGPRHFDRPRASTARPKLATEALISYGDGDVGERGSHHYLGRNIVTLG